MSLYGALYSAVSGIQSQSTAIGIISDNVSNINTIGYKAGSQYFSTLVTNSGAGVAYSPGGVRAQNRQLISQQGLVQSSNSPLDLAVSGNGMFVVQDAVRASDIPTTMYTRAGSFRKDSLGNFVNAAGLYLKAWPLDGNGNIPSNFSSPASLQLVNVSNATGAAAATTNVDMGINLDAEKPIFKGSGITMTPGSEAGTTENRGVTSTQIMIPNANMSLNDSITVTTTGTVVNSKSFIYGGIDESVELGDGTGGTTKISNDYGASGSWSTIPGISNTFNVDGERIQGVAISNDGQYMYLSYTYALGGIVRKSSDYGATWQTVGVGTQFVRDISCSSDGSTVMVTGATQGYGGGYLSRGFMFKSTNYGASYTGIQSGEYLRNWARVGQLYTVTTPYSGYGTVMTYFRDQAGDNTFPAETYPSGGDTLGTVVNTSTTGMGNRVFTDCAVGGTNGTYRLLGSTTGLFRSVTGGGSWTQL
jgi:flagellar hook protein FlgE